MCFVFTANVFWDNPIFFEKKKNKNNNYYLMNSYFKGTIETADDIVIRGKEYRFIHGDREYGRTSLQWREI